MGPNSLFKFMHALNEEISFENGRQCVTCKKTQNSNQKKRKKNKKIYSFR